MSISSEDLGKCDGPGWFNWLSSVTEKRESNVTHIGQGGPTDGTQKKVCDLSPRTK